MAAAESSRKAPKAQQLRHHEQKRGQTEERWRNSAYIKAGPGCEKFEENNGYWASQLWWDAGNTLQYVLKSFTDAQQLRQHEQEREQTEERR